MPQISAQKIANYRKLIANKPRDMALNIIAKLHPNDTVPIILDILSHALPELEKEVDNQATIDFVRFTKKMLEQVQLNQQAPGWKVPGILKTYKATIHKNLQELDDRVKLVKVTRPMAKYWQEAEVWLQGWYQRSYELAEKDGDIPKRDKDGKYLRYDLEDSVFYSVVGMTKLEVAEHYQRVAATIKTQLDGLASQPVASPVATAVSSSSLAASQPANDSEAVIPPPADIIQIESAGRGTRMILNLPTKDKTTLRRVTDAVMLALNPEQEILSIINGRPLTNYGTRPSDSGMAEMLNSVVGEPDDVKITVLEHGVRTIGLTDKQVQMLSGFKDQAVARLTGYINSTYKLWGTQISLLPGLFVPWHTKLAKEKKEELIFSDRVEEQLKIMFDLRNQLIGDNSQNLLPQVTEAILGVFSILQKVPNREVVLASAARP